MQPLRKLVLKSETLTDLTTDELRAVAGGDDTNQCASRYCETAGFTCTLSHLICRLTDACELTGGCDLTGGCH